MPLVPTTAQRAAITAPMGPQLVVAGPGAGKTYCLIERIGHVIATHGLDPERICAVTFTNKAAEEIGTRLRESLGPAAGDVTRGTLHALCVQILRDNGAAIGLPRGFGIADEAYQLLVLARLNVRPEGRRRSLLTLFSRRRFQQHDLTADDEGIFGEYEATLERQKLLDFDQIIARTARLFSAHPEIAGSVAERWDYVLVDEFQDLDRAQYAVLAALAQSHRNIFAVGDDEQSIFSWRGADARILATFAEDFETGTPIVLDENRRCSKQIFAAARRLLADGASLFTKELHANRESAFEVEAYAFTDDDDEAAWIIGDLVADRAAHDLAWGDVALLYRRHDVGNALEGALLRAGVPCRLARGRALHDDDVIRYVVCALAVMRHPDDPMRVERLAEEVLPSTVVDRIRMVQRDERVEFPEAVRRFALGNPRTDPDTRKAWRFVYQSENLRAMPGMHETLDGIVEALLSQRVGRYRNLLEEWHDELSDPADRPAAVALAGQLRSALHGQRRVWVAGRGPLRIALLGMLLKAGMTIARYHDGADTVPEGDVMVRADPLTLFKALQLVHSGEFAETFRNYVAFDLETTDKDPATCEIVELGAARVRDGEIVDRFQTLVRPRRAVTAGARAAHGYSDAELAGAPFFEEVWPRFRAFVGGDLLVAHNGFKFDVPVVRRMAQPLGGVDDLVFFDSYVMARALVRSGLSLEALAEQFGVRQGRAHHALDDAEALVAVFGALNRARIVRARKAAMVELLEYLGLGMALDTQTPGDAEWDLLKDKTATYALSRYAECLDFYEEERKRLADPELPSRDAVIDLLGGRRQYERLQAERTPEQRYPEAMSRLRRVLGASRRGTLEESIDRLLEHVALSTSQGTEVDRHRVNLLTLHSTKGLEFSRVYIVGVEDHEIPGYRAVARNLQDEIEEGRRLLYVGMTRARDRLVLTRVSGRAGREAGRNRFLDEIGLVPTHPVAHAESPVPR